MRIPAAVLVLVSLVFTPVRTWAQGWPPAPPVVSPVSADDMPTQVISGDPLLVVTPAGARLAEAQGVPMIGGAGPQVFVRLKDGASIEGTLVTLGDASVTLLVDRLERTIPLAAVTRIERDGDGSGDGATKGGVILGLLCALVCGQGVTSGDQHLAGIATNATIGALVGWQIDRSHRARTLIYPKTSDRPREPTDGAEFAPQALPPTESSPVRRHVVSFGPFSLAYGDPTVEYERRVGPWFTAGLIAARTTRPSLWKGQEKVTDDERQLLTDIVVRLYPGHRALSGASLGLRVGAGFAAGHVSPGMGYDAAYNWRFDTPVSVSLGVSQERVFTVVRGSRPVGSTFWPVLRLHVGIAF